MAYFACVAREICHTSAFAVVSPNLLPAEWLIDTPGSANDGEFSRILEYG